MQWPRKYPTLFYALLLVRLGHQYKEAGKDWYRWAKATAIRLWESGHIVK